MNFHALMYSFLVLSTLLADRVAKWYALHSWVQEQVITPFLSFQLTFNRGISWGILHAADRTVFIAMTTFIVSVTTVLAVYAIKRYRQGHSAVGELLVVSGSCSNIIDRFFYGGVIDFIMVHKGELVWPLFNIADFCIVLGVFIMAMQLRTANAHA